MTALAVNGRFLSRPVTGVERYAGEILQRLGPGLRTIRPGRQPHGAAGHAWEQLILPARLSPGELLWSPANSGPLAVARQVLTLHDLGPLENPGWYSAAFARWYRILIPLLVRRARHVTVSSEYVRQKLLSRFSLPAGAVSVVRGGVDLARFRPGACPPAGLPEKYILFVGSLMPRKNLGVLLEAWRRIQARHAAAWLLVAGAGGAVFGRQVFPGGVERLGWLGYVSDGDLPGLYAGAQVCVLPSLEEGFGLTALEALACGTPLVAARAGALPETAGEAALWFDPADAAGLAACLDECLQNPSLRRLLSGRGLERAAGMGWEQPAQTMREILLRWQ